MDLTFKLRRCTNPTQKNIILGVELLRIQNKNNVVCVKDISKFLLIHPKQVYRELSFLEKNHILLIYNNGKTKEVLL